MSRNTPTPLYKIQFLNQFQSWYMFWLLYFQALRTSYLVIRGLSSSEEPQRWRVVFVKTIAPSFDQIGPNWMKIQNFRREFSVRQKKLLNESATKSLYLAYGPYGMVILSQKFRKKSENDQSKQSRFSKDHAPACIKNIWKQFLWHDLWLDLWHDPQFYSFNDSLKNCFPFYNFL